MLRFLAAFVVLFAGAAAALSLLPNPPKLVQPRSAVAAQLHAEAQPAVDHPQVRVVYPAPATEVSPPASIVSTASTVATPAMAMPAPVAPVYPQAQNTAAAETAAPVQANPAAQAGTQNINLNTASVDTLNQIPGAGRIGRTIASHRPYHSVEDLLRKRVVRKDVYERIKAQVAAE